jgi:hypothetical protein
MVFFMGIDNRRMDFERMTAVGCGDEASSYRDLDYTDLHDP